ncbi:DUF1236 domain-containing protein [Chelativorans salis]|uniref:DUF1236 domain-containing protein n=1 Tax=Chelativorans salis TaxID=2978478 RepID=A0ABT2LX52_9HYPH|nr:DUF1236 domain-containing protein [Chelativorans sp. EGI FJ00035]MCT7378689.1 DUF1236 domain-containing protein [Chelativorans sp. EGI FJ00035]
MKAKLSATVASLMLLAGTAAAQDIVISPEQETVIREYVIANPVEPVQPPPGVSIEVGTALPDTIQLRPLEVPDVTYHYVILEGRTVLVEPQTREIVYVIEQ